MIYSNFKRLALISLVPVTFLVVSLLTLSDYGINWDEPIHIIRGQAYLHFILTGKRDFLDFPAYPALKGAPDIVDFNVGGATNSSVVKHGETKGLSVRRSYYQSDFYTYDYFLTKHIHTHPEVNDLLLASTNYIFYQKLGLVGDIEAYHLFIVLITFTLIAATAWWVYRSWGIFASVVAASSLALYPLVFAESHFNFKDPILMSFFGISIFSFVYGFSKDKFTYIILSAILFGFALGTKFNALFLVPILGFWLTFVLAKRYSGRKDKFNLVNLLGGWKMLIAILLFPLISLGIVYIFSPYLWVNPVGHFIEIVNYYKDIGVGTPEEQSAYLVGGWNTYPLVWIFATTPLPILLLSILGFFYALFLSLKRSDMAFLILLWFAVPVIRVMWPGTNIYGGVRQIMEFVPAMAILSGMGAFFLARWNSRLVVLLVTASLLFVAYEMTRIHPNQNVYFNQLIGGLMGAQKKEVPSWGNSFGNVYLQGINWLNENGEPNAKLALAVNYLGSIPRLKLRADIDLDNAHWSGPERAGEYGMELSYDWPLKSRYKYAYYETFLNPVYEVTVDGVVLLKVWKNDLAHTRKGFEKEVMIKQLSVKVEQQKIKVDFASKVFLTRLIIDHSTDGCLAEAEDGFVSTSQDGINFVREYDPLFDPESPYASPGMDENTFVYMFPARPALSIIFNPQQPNPCIFKDIKVTVWGLAKNP